VSFDMLSMDILLDKFHIMRHLGEALDAVRKSEYARLSGKDRRYIKGQKYTLLSRRENLTLEGRAALKLLRANKRLNTAYLLKESLGQLWSYEREGFARRFFENRRAALKWQRLKPYETFVAMIDRHWDGIAACCRPETRSRSASSRGSTTRSACSSAMPRACAIKNISASRSSAACFRRYDPHNHPLDSLKTQKKT
jgi:hypothetical protein